MLLAFRIIELRREDNYRCLSYYYQLYPIIQLLDVIDRNMLRWVIIEKYERQKKIEVIEFFSIYQVIISRMRYSIE